MSGISEPRTSLRKSAMRGTLIRCASDAGGAVRKPEKQTFRCSRSTTTDRLELDSGSPSASDEISRPPGLWSVFVRPEAATAGTADDPRFARQPFEVVRGRKAHYISAAGANGDTRCAGFS